MPPSTSHRRTRSLIWLLAVFLLARVVLLFLLPHQDPSEARYAEMARKMVETGNWVTPQHSYGVPFWAKPPLSMWMSALGMEIFGVNEFGSRIFIFMVALAILCLIGWFAAKQWSPPCGWMAAAILMGMPLFFYCSAAVMTDLILLAGICLSMIAFIMSMRGKSSILWGYLFFVGLSAGLLAKGPLVFVITFVPVFSWILFTRSWRRAWDGLPWFPGTVLMISLVSPWYVLAELRTPGFLNYFILGEHWHRFVDSGWTGDLYGKAHAETPGTIWLLAALGSFPWCIGFLSLPVSRWRSFGAWARENDGMGFYLAIWAIWPLIFFTPARNIISTYPLPALPAIALLLTSLHHRRSSESPLPGFHPLHPSLAFGSAAIAVIFAAVSLLLPEYSPKHSERQLVRIYQTLGIPGDDLVYFGRRGSSAEFYSGGTAINTRSNAALTELLDRSGTLFVAVSEKNHTQLPRGIRERLRLVAPFKGHHSLYREMPSPYQSASLGASGN
jgi:4-amino-4-deoxy-L-arabinose transferase-like glycosyltransferase